MTVVCYRCRSWPCRCKDGITVVHGDCRDVMAAMESDTFDVALLDPPYGIVNKFGEHIGRPGKGNRKMEFEWDKAEAVGQAVGQAAGLCKHPAAVICFCGLDTVEPIQSALRAAGMTTKPMVWVKECPPPPLPGNWWPSGFELGIYAYHPGAWFGDNDPKRSNVFYSDSLRYGQPDKNGHPTQKPLGLIRRLLGAICRPGSCVLDPFMGSGTTLRAAKDLGYRALGIELDERWCKVAATRLKQDVLFV